MRQMVVLNNPWARVTLDGEVEQVDSGEYAVRGRLKLGVGAKTPPKERFVREFYEGIFGSSQSYEEAVEEFGPDILADTDDMLPDLSKPVIRIYSKTLCEWKDPAFTISHYDDVWNDAGMQCGEDSVEAAKMRLANGTDSVELSFDMVEQAQMIETLFLSDRLQWPPAIELSIDVFFDFQAAQGEGTFFKTVSHGLTLCPARLPMQAIVLDYDAGRYRLIAGPARGAVRFILRPGTGITLNADSVGAPAGCSSAVITVDREKPAELLAIGSSGEMAHVIEALARAQRTYYQLEIADAPAEEKPFELTHDSIAAFDATALKLLDDGSMIPAKEAVVTVQEPTEHDLWSAVVIGEPHARHVVISIDQARGTRAARNNSKAVLTSPGDFTLRRTQQLRVKLTVGALELTRTLLVSITLPRWFPLEGSDEETHLRTNHATLLQGLRDAIARFNANHEGKARFNVAAREGFDKVRAGLFLFGHNPPDNIGRTYYFTQPEEVQSTGSLAGRWLNTLRGVPAPDERPPSLTEAALLVRIIELQKAKGQKLTPGDVFGLGLEETGGDIGAALLLGHNTMRSLARDGGDGLRTGIFALDKERFDQLFITIRGGYRCSDGSAGAIKNEHCAQANFANDNAGPWYHYFGTAFYEIYSATPDDSTPADNLWARSGNVAEQWYREYAPWSWQDADPEKETVNRWGIVAADELLREQPWMGD